MGLTVLLSAISALTAVGAVFIATIIKPLFAAPLNSPLSELFGAGV